MSKAYEEMQERRLHLHIASELGITIDELNEYSYQLDENTSHGGMVYGWRILWDTLAPPNVHAHGTAGAQWSNICEMHESDERD